MRIQMKLNSDSASIIEQYSKIKFKHLASEATLGLVLGLAIDKIREKEIDWKVIDDIKILDIVDVESVKNHSITTTININKKDLDFIDNIKLNFNKAIVHRAFKIKLILIAAIIEENNV